MLTLLLGISVPNIAHNEFNNGSSQSDGSHGEEGPEPHLSKSGGGYHSILMIENELIQERD